MICSSGSLRYDDHTRDILLAITSLLFAGDTFSVSFVLHSSEPYVLNLEMISCCLIQSLGGLEPLMFSSLVILSTKWPRHCL